MWVVVLIPALITLGIGLVVGWIVRGMWDEEEVLAVRDQGRQGFFSSSAPPSHVRTRSEPYDWSRRA